MRWKSLSVSQAVGMVSISTRLINLMLHSQMYVSMYAYVHNAFCDTDILHTYIHMYLINHMHPIFSNRTLRTKLLIVQGPTQSVFLASISSSVSSTPKGPSGNFQMVRECSTLTIFQDGTKPFYKHFLMVAMEISILRLRSATVWYIKGQILPLDKH